MQESHGFSGLSRAGKRLGSGEQGKARIFSFLPPALLPSLPSFFPPTRTWGRARRAFPGCRWPVCRGGGAEIVRGRLFLGFKQARTLSKACRLAQHPHSLGVEDLLASSRAVHTQAEGSWGRKVLLRFCQPLLLISCVWLRLLRGLHVSGSFHFMEQ